MAEDYTTKTVEVRALEPHEDAEITLFDAPFEGVIANVTFTPSEDIKGAYYTRALHLQSKRNGQERMVADIQLDSTDILLPGNERHNARLTMPPSALLVREGDSLVWSSIGSVGEGLTVPEATVEIVFEQKVVTGDPSSPEYWRDSVPNYWIGKKVLIEHCHRDIHGPNRMSGSGSLYFWEDVGTFRGADSEVFQVSIDPIEHGNLPRDTGFLLTQTMQLKLTENQ